MRAHRRALRCCRRSSGGLRSWENALRSSIPPPPLGYPTCLSLPRLYRSLGSIALDPIAIWWLGSAATVGNAPYSRSGPSAPDWHPSTRPLTRSLPLPARYPPLIMVHGWVYIIHGFTTTPFPCSDWPGSLAVRSGWLAALGGCFKFQVHFSQRFLDLLIGDDNPNSSPES